MKERPYKKQIKNREEKEKKKRIKEERKRRHEILEKRRKISISQIRTICCKPFSKSICNYNSKFFPTQIISTKNLSLRQMKCALSFFDCNLQPRAQHFQRRIVWQLQIVHTGHNTRQVIIGGKGGFTGLANHSEKRRKSFESYTKIY